MNEIYWLLILDNIEKVFTATSVLTVLGIGVILVGLFGSGYSTKEEEEALEKGGIKWMKRLLVIFVLSVLCNIFIPNTKQAMMIWGIGGTIDYVKSNNTAKQLPDKCIKALDKFVDEYMFNEENNKEK